MMKEKTSHQPPEPTARARSRDSAQPSGKDMRSIIQIHDWPAAAVAELLAESEQEGFRFVRRAQDEWQSGKNRFSLAGEALFAVFEAERLMAIGGINRESEQVGRLRRFYVRREGRRRGIGRQLAEHVLGFARRHYSQVALRCETETADRFHLALGFNRTASQAGATHVIDLTKNPSPPPP